jgi:hypothetical protein
MTTLRIPLPVKMSSRQDNATQKVTLENDHDHDSAMYKGSGDFRCAVKM